MKTIKAFAEFCKSMNAPTHFEGDSFTLNKFYREAGRYPNADRYSEFISEINQRMLSSNSIQALYIDTTVLSEGTITGKDSLDLSTGIDSLSIDCKYIALPNYLHLKNVTIKNLTVKSHLIEIDTVVFENCNIVSLHAIERTKLKLLNCNIGTLHLQRDALSQVSMEGGCILNIDCPVPSSSNPFVGSIRFKNRVFLPRDTIDYLIKDAQPYSNMRYYLSQIENY